MELTLLRTRTRPGAGALTTTWDTGVSDVRPRAAQSKRPRHRPFTAASAHSSRQGLLKRFGITGARGSPQGAEDILKIRAVVVNGDLDDYMRYYKQRYRDEHHLARYDPATIEDLNLAA